MAQTPLCPICKRSLETREDALRFRPFCSKRCADIDLGRWLKGAYAVPATEADNEDGEAGGGAARGRGVASGGGPTPGIGTSSRRAGIRLWTGSRGWTGRDASSKKPGPSRRAQV